MGTSGFDRRILAFSPHAEAPNLVKNGKKTNGEKQYALATA